MNSHAFSFLPPPGFFINPIELHASNTARRTAFNLSGTEAGLGNPDQSSEVFYLLDPNVISETGAAMNFSTGRATRIPVTNEPVPTPTATPTPSPTPKESPTPQTPPAVQGLAGGMLANVTFTSGINQPIVARTAVGSLDRRFNLPMELSGVTMTIGGATVGLKSVFKTRNHIRFATGSRRKFRLSL